jgi:hypothetical protein
MNFKIAKLELENSYEDHIDFKKLKEREILVHNFSAHLSRIVDLGQEEISRRLRVPFEEDHIVINRGTHQKLIDLVEGAFTDVLRSREDVDLAKWSHTAVAPLKPLVRNRIHQLLVARSLQIYTHSNYSHQKIVQDEVLQAHCRELQVAGHFFPPPRRDADVIYIYHHAENPTDCFVTNNRHWPKGQPTLCFEFETVFINYVLFSSLRLHSPL